jgi:hypothetical protein
MEVKIQVTCLYTCVGFWSVNQDFANSKQGYSKKTISLLLFKCIMSSLWFRRAQDSYLAPNVSGAQVRHVSVVVCFY